MLVIELDVSGQAFTFHYVSIKSVVDTRKYRYILEFTFHYVSIKSTSTAGRALEYTNIYIPLCIY